MWSRIEDTVPHHRKFIGLGSGASWMWVCGLVHSGVHLSDGYIDRKQLGHLGDLKHPLKWARTLVKAGLWEEVEGGYQIHDYHDFNPRAADIKQRREADRVRKDSLRNPHRQPAVSTRSPSALARARDLPSHPSTVQEQATERDRGVQPPPPANGNGNTGHASLSPVPKPKPTTTDKGDPFVNESITMRAGDFIRRYTEDLYPTHLNGARYVPNPSRDYFAAVWLCQTWPDDRRLDRIAIVFLKTDHHFAVEGSRTITQFKALASWCDGRLSAVEAGKA